MATNPQHPIRDTHFKLEGPVVDQLATAFAADWAFADGENLDGPPWFTDPEPVGNTVARAVTSGPDADVQKIEQVVIQALGCARRSVRIATPYFLPDELVTGALTQAATRGVLVEVVIPEKGDHRAIDWAMRAHLDPLIRAGVRVYLDPPPFDHSKAMVVDDVWCFVGSANWDMRSFRLNFELNVEIIDPTIAAEIDALIRRKMGPRLTRRTSPRGSCPCACATQPFGCCCHTCERLRVRRLRGEGQMHDDGPVVGRPPGQHALSWQTSPRAMQRSSRSGSTSTMEWVGRRGPISRKPGTIAGPTML